MMKKNWFKRHQTLGLITILFLSFVVGLILIVSFNFTLFLFQDTDSKILSEAEANKENIDKTVDNIEENTEKYEEKESPKKEEKSTQPIVQKKFEILPEIKESPSCGILEVLKNNECIECGSEGENCCENNNCFGLFPSLECQNDICTACGEVGEACCGNNECNSIFPSSICQSGTCERCGGEHEQCCSENECGFGNSCKDGFCKSCGNLNEACCSDDSPYICLIGGCVDNTCQICGILDTPCCNGDQCNNYYACVEGVCELDL